MGQQDRGGSRPNAANAASDDIGAMVFAAAEHQGTKVAKQGSQGLGSQKPNGEPAERKKRETGGVVNYSLFSPWGSKMELHSPSNGLLPPERTTSTENKREEKRSKNEKNW